MSTSCCSSCSGYSSCSGCRHCKSSSICERYAPTSTPRSDKCGSCKCKLNPEPEECSRNPNTQLWEECDYKYSNGVSSCVNFAVKSTSYNSPMALDGTAYRTEPWKDDYQPRYYLHEASTMYPPGVYVPSGFDWNRGPSYWYNDTTYEIGQGNYSAIMGGLFYTSILIGQTIIRVKMTNPDADVTDLLYQMCSSLHGSTNIFRWFTQLVDSYSNRIVYNPNTPSGKLKQLLSVLISSSNTININWFAQELRNFLANYFPNGQTELYAYIDQMIVYIKKVLYGSQLEFTSWFMAMSNNQEHIRTCYGAYKEFYESNRGSAATKKLNEFCRKFINVSEHIAAFFGAFFFFIVIMDRAMTLLGSPTPPALPTDKANDILNYVLSNQLAGWRQYIWTFLDYSMVAANKEFPDRHRRLFEIQTTMLEITSPLSLSLGKILFTLDRLVRGRNLYMAFE